MNIYSESTFLNHLRFRMNMRTIKQMLPLMLAAVLSVILISCSDASSDNESSMQQELDKLLAERDAADARIAELQRILRVEDEAGQVKAVPVRMTTLEPLQFEHYIEIQGTVESERNALVSPRQAGVVTKLFVREGDRVAQGAILAQLDDNLFRRQLEESQTQLEFAKTIFERRQRVWEQKVGSEFEYLKAKNDVETLERRISTINQQIDDMQIRAPFAGIVDDVIPKVGEAVQPGVGAFRVVSNKRLKVAVEVSESYRANIKRGDKVKVIFPNLGIDTIKARIAAISESIDAVNRSFTVFVNIPASQSDIRPNMLCTVMLNDVTKEDILVAPVNTVQRFNNEQFVYVVAQDSEGLVARRRVVETGLTYRSQIEIVKGLEPGDQLVTVGFQDLADGKPVLPQ